MGYVTTELINLFNFLLPGFITSFLSNSLTSFPKKSTFELVVLALIYTVIINSFVEALGWAFLAIGKFGFSIAEWSSTAKALWSFFFAVIFGLSIAYFYTNDTLHKILRKLKITNQTSYPSEWYGTFTETHSYVVLHFTDGRRLMGWPEEWPSSPKNGHFILQNAAWLVETDGKTDQIELSNVEKIILDATIISMVEFVAQTITPGEGKSES